MLLADATALIALGEVGRIDLLRFYDPLVVIGPAVEAEIIRSRDQVVAALAAGWLRVEPANWTKRTAG